MKFNFENRRSRFLFKVRVTIATRMLIVGSSLINWGIALMPAMFKRSVAQVPVARITVSAPDDVTWAAPPNASHRLQSPPALVAIAIMIAVFFYSLALVRHVKADEVGSQWDLMLPQRGQTLTTVAAGHAWANGQVVGGRPPGCKVRRYCGCDLSVEIFGRADPALFPAKAWFKFQRAQPAPGMVAVRQHHVMKLLAHVSGQHWTVRDPNSGRGLTRIHVRSIAGFVIVNPYLRKV